MLEKLSEGAGKLTKTQLTRRQSRANEMKERRKKATEYQRGLPDSMRGNSPRGMTFRQITTLSAST